jgi:hypothetical protein
VDHRVKPGDDGFALGHDEDHAYSASAPEMISISSLVIAAWRVQL